MINPFVAKKPKQYKIRFNLSRGKNYLKWKVEHPDGKIVYYNPIGSQLIMHDCTLKNYSKVSERIFKGRNKSVCAWVLCNTIELRHDNFLRDKTTRVKYNPRVQPNWMIDDQVSDNIKLGSVYSIDYSLYTSKI